MWVGLVMVVAISALVLLLTTGPVAAVGTHDCTAPVTQVDMNLCASQAYRDADMALNDQWRITAAEMRLRDRETEQNRDDRPGYFAQLLAAQRAWIAYRDAHCASEGYSARGGSLEPMLVSNCLTLLTRERTAQLLALVNP